MRDLATNVLANLLSDILLILFASVLLFFFARMARHWRRSRLIDFFKLSTQEPVINLYLSRHQSTTNLPTINTSLSTVQNRIDALERIKALQIREENQKRFQGKEQSQLHDFTTVSAEEMLEALRLRDELQKSVFFDWLPGKIREELSRSKAGGESIQVNIIICPPLADYSTLASDENDETMIFIGGPRANLGTYYYLYGEKIGQVRPGRLKKNIVEYIDSGGKIACPEGQNLAVIQRSTKRSATRTQTIVYLAGTGVNGTVCAVAYLRKNWQKLQQQHGQKDFSVVLECSGRKKDISDYVSKDEHQWSVRAELSG